jgi:hypothetical protein
MKSLLRCLWMISWSWVVLAPPLLAAQEHHDHPAEFSIQSIASGKWSNPKSWSPARVPTTGDRVLIRRGTEIEYDQQGEEVIRLIQVVGTLRFSTDRDTELNVGILSIAHQEECDEHGFACEFEGGQAGPSTPKSQWPTLLIGTADSPLPSKHTAKVRLHYFEGMDPKSAPALACCSGRMEIHGSPLKKSWIKLGEDAAEGDVTLTLSEEPTGWKVGDEILITATQRVMEGSTFRQGKSSSKVPQSEERLICHIDGRKISLDGPLDFLHRGTGEFRGEVANLSRNIVIESADPEGVRGHTVYHRFSQGNIRYASFESLGKEGVLGRYPIHFHLVGDTMRGSRVEGVVVRDSHNRWITIHGTNFLVVRDCIGYRSVGHGFFMEDGTEVMNLLERNLAVQSSRGKPLPKQVLSFDPNEGAGFWWANGLNTLVNNVSVENDEYGYRYDIQKRSNFDTRLPVRQANGEIREIDVRTLPIWRFENNEAHAEGFYGMVVAANGNDQPDTPIDNQRMLEAIRRVDWTGPDTRHPHIIRSLRIWGAHYAFRPHSPSMLMEDVSIDDAVYGIYRPAYDHHVYRDLRIAHVQSEPFNRGMDDASAQSGPVTVDGLTFVSGYGNRTTPLIQISDVNLTGEGVTHLRRVTVNRPDEFQDRWPLINRGVGTRVPPILDGVPIFIHDHYGPGRHAKVVSTAAKDLILDGNEYRTEPGLTSDESRVAEVAGVEWPEVLQPVDDLPPATMITSITRDSDKLIVRGLSHDNGEVTHVRVNERVAELIQRAPGVYTWEIAMDAAGVDAVQAQATDDAGNREQTPHRIQFEKGIGFPQN